jgi:hypothetical protein
MAKGAMALPTKVERETETISVTFRSEKEVPKNFEDLEIDDEVRLVVVGKVYSTNRSKRSKSNDYNDAARISITQDKIKIILVKEDAASLKDAMDSADNARRM